MKKTYWNFLTVGILITISVLIFVVGVKTASADYYNNTAPYPDYNNYNYNNYNGYSQYDTSYSDHYRYSHPYYNTLSVYCTSTTYPENNGSNHVTWNAYASGGIGSYNYSWSGTDNVPISNSSSITYNYPYPGAKRAWVTVWSGNQVVSKDCGSIYVNNYYYNQYTPPPFNYTPGYYNNYNSYSTPPSYYFWE